MSENNFEVINDDNDSNDSVPSDLSFEFTGENCQKRVDEFVAITYTNDALAQMFLQDRKWNVARSVNDYFNELTAENEKKMKKQLKDDSDSESDEKEDDEDEDDKVASFKKQKLEAGPSAPKVESDEATGSEGKQQKLFRHITWNIDGLNDKNLKVRTEAVCSRIVKEKASFVFLQEITQENEGIIRAKLKDSFEIFSGKTYEGGYYSLTLVSKEPFIKVQNNEIINFPSIMGRNLLQTNVTLHDAKICLLNTHLESTKEGEAYRIQQLSSMLNHIKKIGPDVTVIAGGDLNLRDKELAGIGGLPPNIVDAWEASGSRKELQFTWDMMRNDNLNFQSDSKGGWKPRMRFDRVFLRRTSPSTRIDLVHFGLIGLERLKPHVCFPSDHWSIITSYQIFN